MGSSTVTAALTVCSVTVAAKARALVEALVVTLPAVVLRCSTGAAVVPRSNALVTVLDVSTMLVRDVVSVAVVVLACPSSAVVAWTVVVAVLGDTVAAEVAWVEDIAVVEAVVWSAADAVLVVASAT